MHGSEILDHPEQWVDAYGDYLYRYALFRSRDHHLAEDLVQETFLAALDARARFGGQSTVRTWLVGILNHKFLDHLRKAARERPEDDPERSAHSPQGEAAFLPDGHPYVPRWDANPEQIAEEKAFQAQFAKCLSGLTPRFFEIYTMRELDELPFEEICNNFNLSPTNVRVILHRARNLIRECLEKTWFAAS